MRINHNITAMIANNKLNRNNENMARAIERLSSGYRINRAKDDAAGLAISQKMRTQIRSLKQASNNTGDGISMIETAEGALTEVHAMLRRMKELAVQAATETNSPEEREAIQDEINVMRDEISRISDSCEFNQKKLLNGDIGRATYVDTGAVVKGAKTLEISEQVGLGEYTYTVSRDARQAVVTGGAVAMAPGATITKEQAGVIKINGEEVVIQEGDTTEDVYTKLQNLCDWTDNKLLLVEDMDNTAGLPENAGYSPTDKPFGAGTSMVIVSNHYGSKEKLEISCNNPELAALMGIEDTNVRGTDVEITLGEGFSPTAKYQGDGHTVTITDSSGFLLTMEITQGACGTTFTDAPMGTIGGGSTSAGGTAFDANVRVLDAGIMVFQIGANQEEIMNVSIPQMSPKNLGIHELNFCAAEDASEAIHAIDLAIEKVSKVRAKLGAYQNRLEHTETNLGVAEESMTSSLARIFDCDMAAEMTNYTQQNLLVQTATNVLAKANANPESILQLLQQ